MWIVLGFVVGATVGGFIGFMFGIVSIKEYLDKEVEKDLARLGKENRKLREALDRKNHPMHFVQVGEPQLPPESVTINNSGDLERCGSYRSFIGGFDKVEVPLTVFPVWDHALDCACTTWARDWYQMAPFHHPNCSKYDPTYASKSDKQLRALDVSEAALLQEAKFQADSEMKALQDNIAETGSEKG